MGTAIVTLAIGAEVSDRWHRVCEANWRSYAKRHGYELICIEQPLDHSKRARDRSPSWQKLLVPGQAFAAQYERVVWIDSDVYFGHGAPAITDGVPVERVGAVDEVEMPSPEVQRLFHAKPREVYYREFGLPGHFEQIVQAGVMVLSPRHHRDLFERVYRSYEDKPEMFFEMRPLSYELLRADLVHWLDPRFNRSWSAYKAHRYPHLLGHSRHPLAPEAAARALDEVHCLHFAGEAEQMDFALRRVLDRPTARWARPSRVRAPVVLFTHGRRDARARALEAIAAARPPRVLELRGGSKSRIESGLDWAFSQVEKAIVLRDDCVPEPSFFGFCDELLERYHEDERVMSISGSSFQFDGSPTDDSYYLSRYPSGSGWATWRRAWNRYDPEMTAWPELRDRGWLEEQFDDPNVVAYWSHMLDAAHRDRDSWQLAWLLAGWMCGGLHVTPTVNLVSAPDPAESAPHPPAAHRSLIADLPAEPIRFPLRHPRAVAPDADADRYLERLLFGGNIPEMFQRLRRLRRIERGAW